MVFDAHRCWLSPTTERRIPATPPGPPRPIIKERLQRFKTRNWPALHQRLLNFQTWREERQRAFDQLRRDQLAALDQAILAGAMVENLYVNTLAGTLLLQGLCDPDGRPNRIGRFRWAAPPGPIRGGTRLIPQVTDADSEGAAESSIFSWATTGYWRFERHIFLEYGRFRKWRDVLALRTENRMFGCLIGFRNGLRPCLSPFEVLASVAAGRDFPYDFDDAILVDSAGAAWGFQWNGYFDDAYFLVPTVSAHSAHL
ncbi:MAG TPA: hypothetical protein PKD86_11020 [Gemmatales bacterium]|nr:hypothetical protein [Gemmatales bacterium]HMP59876.1 hypothetical protein [Gemmatales bacterium]